MSKRRFRHMAKILTWAVLAVVCATATGCDESSYEREPPPGQGTLYIENFTGDRLRVYAEGVEQESVSPGKSRYYDRPPGGVRMVLDGDTGRTWAGDLDILEGRRTILQVRLNYGNDTVFEVRRYLDN